MFASSFSLPLHALLVFHPFSPFCLHNMWSNFQFPLQSQSNLNFLQQYQYSEFISISSPHHFCIRDGFFLECILKEECESFVVNASKLSRNEIKFGRLLQQRRFAFKKKNSIETVLSSFYYFNEWGTIGIYGLHPSKCTVARIFCLVVSSCQINQSNDYTITDFVEIFTFTQFFNKR